MPDRVTLEVIDRPAGGVLRSLREIRGIRSVKQPGMRALLALGTADFVPRVRPAPTPRRIGVLAAWDGGGDVETRWAGVLAGFVQALVSTDMSRRSWFVLHSPRRGRVGLRC